MGLFKAKAITRERLIQMLHPPMEDDLIHDLKSKIEPEEKAAAQAQAAAEAKKGAANNGGQPKLSAVE